jgi:serine/threonine protein kinase/WD40 repeat protein
MSDAPSELDPVEELADSFLERYRRGERPSLSEYTRQYPELAEQIRELFPALVVVEELGSLGGAASTVAKREAFRLPEHLGEYRLVREIGRGGMGIVYEAVQESLGRHVALKVLPYHGLLNPSHLERFRREARAVARLHHTNIVPVFGVGEHEGIHYYAMQFIHGQALHEVVQEVKRLRVHKETELAPPNLAASVAESLLSGIPVSALPPEPNPSRAGFRYASQSGLTTQPEALYFRSVAQIGIQVAEALEYAHGQGVLHRDIKPSNLLLDTSSRIWVTDFGLAKADESAELTDPGDLVGTLSYMAPERFQGNADVRSDVYGLGTTLYELATLQPAFADSQRARLIEKVVHDEPRRPRKLDPQIPRDLETVILKASAKDPGQRYATAGDLAEDLRRFLADRPIHARPTPQRERLWRWCRRNPVVALLSAAVALCVIAITVVASVAAWWLGAEAQRARGAEHDATVKLWNSYVAQAQASRWSGRTGQRFASLEALANAAQVGRFLGLSSQDFLDLRNEAIACLPLTDVRMVRQGGSFLPGNTALRFDANLERYALSDSRGMIRICRTRDARELACLGGTGKPASDLRFSPDGRYLAATRHAGADMWDVAGGRLLFTTPPCASDASLDWNPDSRAVIVGLRDHSIVSYAVPSGKEVRHLDPAIPGDRIALRPGGRQVAASGWVTHSVELRDLATGEVLHEFKHPRAVEGLCWSPEGRYLACACEDTHIYLWDLSGMRPKSVLRGHQMGVRGLAFNQTGDLLVSLGWDATLRFWNPRTGKQLVSCPGASLTPQFNRDDTRLSGIVQGTALVLLEVGAACEFRTLENELADPAWVWGVDFSSDGRLLATASDTGVRLWDLAHTGNGAQLDRTRCGSVLFQPDGAGLIAWGDAALRRWALVRATATGDPDRPPGTYLKTGAAQTLYTPGKLDVDHRASLTPDGRWLALADRGNHQVVLRSLDKPEQTRVLGNHRAISYTAISPDARWVASSGGSGSGVKLWDVPGKKMVRQLLAEEAGLAFSPDGAWLVTGTAAEYCFWEVRTWQPAFRISRMDASFPGCLAFTRDGKTLALSLSDRAVQLFDVVSRSQLATLTPPEPQMILWLTFDRAGERLAVATQNNFIQLWDLRRIRAQLATIGLDWAPIPSLVEAGTEDLQPLIFDVRESQAAYRLEAEDLKIVAWANCARPWRQGMSGNYDYTQWSQGTQLFCPADTPGASVALEFELPKAATYHLEIYFTKADDYGIVEVSLDGKAIGHRFDGYAPNVIPSGSVDFGRVELARGLHQFRFTVVDKNPASRYSCMGIDCLEFTPIH